MTRFLLALLFLVHASAAKQGQTGVVTGIVRIDTGLPVEGIRVAVIPADALIAESVLESQGLTDSAGRYRLENVSPGRYNILVRRLLINHPAQPDLGQPVGRSNPSIFHPGVAELSRATTIQVVAGSTIEVSDTVFPEKHVSGRVVDLATGNGRRIENLVLCCDYSLPVMMGNGPVVAAAFKASLSDDGSFIFPSVPPGNYYLSTADPRVLTGSWAIAVGEKSMTGLQLDVSEGVEVQGIVVDRSGEPITADVQLRPKPANSVSNTIDPPTNAPVSGPLLLVPKGSSSLDLLREQLLKSAKLPSKTMGPDGRFELRRVSPGTYVLEVRTSGVTLHEQEIQVRSAGLTDVSVQVPAINVPGRVIASGGGPLPKLNYIRLVRSNSDVFYRFPDTDGRFSFVLLPGEYRVFTERLGPSVQSVSDGSRDITNTEFTLEGGRNQQIVVTLQP